MRTLPFWKMEALANDFVLVHLSDIPGDLSLEELAQSACRRHVGVGADGLLVLSPGELRMFNPDGSEDFCGNGLRCAVVHAHGLGWIPESGEMLHHGRPVQCRVTGLNRAKVSLGPARFEPEHVPHKGSEPMFLAGLKVPLFGLVEISAVSTGSTHTVLLRDRLPDDDEVFGLGQLLENHEMFPERTSVIWTVVQDSRTLRIRIWERGAGETQGCGTGSAAAAVVWARKSGQEGDFVVRNPGGEVIVGVRDGWSEVTLESDVTTPFSGQLLLDSPASQALVSWSEGAKVLIQGQS